MKSILILLSLVIGVTFMQTHTMLGAEPVIEVNLFFDRDASELRLDRFVDQPVNVVDATISEYEVYLTQEAMNTIGIDPSDDKYTLVYQGYQADYNWQNFLVGSIREGAFTLRIPYYAHAQSVTIQDSQGNTASISLDAYGKCNQNYICEFEKDENISLCPTDCTGTDINYSAATLQSLQEQNGVIRDEAGTILLQANAEDIDIQSDSNQTGTPWWILVGGIVLVIGATGFWVYQKFFKKSK